jgi:hypothetical protein
MKSGRAGVEPRAAIRAVAIVVMVSSSGARWRRPVGAKPSSLFL